MNIQYERMHDSSLAAWITDKTEQIQSVLTYLQQHFQTTIIQELYGTEQSYIDLEIGGHQIVLHRESMIGICLYVNHPQSEDFLREVVGHILKNQKQCGFL